MPNFIDPIKQNGVQIPNLQTMASNITTLQTTVAGLGSGSSGTVNLFNPMTVSAAGKYIDAATGNLWDIAGCYGSNYIPVESATAYKITGTTQQLAFYDASKVFISGVAEPNGSVTTPATAKYMRTTLLIGELYAVQVEKGTVATTYVPYAYKVAIGVATITAASQDITTGLSKVYSCVVSMVGDPSMNHSFSTATVGDQSTAPTAGKIRIKSWKPTAANDCTPIAAATTFANVAWVAYGV